MFQTMVYLTVLSQLEPRSKGSLGNPIQGGGAEQRRAENEPGQNRRIVTKESHAFESWWEYRYWQRPPNNNIGITDHIISIRNNNKYMPNTLINAL